MSLINIADNKETSRRGNEIESHTVILLELAHGGKTLTEQLPSS